MDLSGGGSSAFQFKNPGDSVTGRITEFSTVPQTHFDGPQKGEPRTFPDGKPMTMIQVELQTELRGSEGLKEAVTAGADDGSRTVWLKANKAPDTTSTMQAVIAAATAAVGKGQIHIGGTLTLTLSGEVKSHTGQLAKAYTARYAAPSADLTPAPAPVVPTPAPAAAVPAVPAPATSPAAVPAPPVAPATAVADPLLANLTPAQLAVLGQPAPVAIPAPPVAVPPPPVAVKTTPEGLTLEQLVAGGWTAEQAVQVYPMLAG
jgi:hypothetical protein